MSWRRSVSCVVMAGALACGRGDAPEDAERARDTASGAADTVPPAEAVARAREAANALGKDLQSRLFAALDSGGPSRAVTFCADSAQAWTARHAREGVYVRRVSLRVRNPANRPDSAEALLLRRLDSLHHAGALPGEVVRSARTPTGERLVEYVRPILVQERCLACHGERERLAPDILTLLSARYPTDQATGYRTGDLRGMLSVRVPEK